MDEKTTYQIYVSLMRLHKKHAKQRASTRDNLTNFVTDINIVNSTFNSNFCNAMTESLRQWYVNEFHGIEEKDIPQFYTELWHFHKKYINATQDESFWEKLMNEIQQLSLEKYNFRSFQLFALAIADELELSSKGGVSK